MSTTARELALQVKVDLNNQGRVIDFSADHSTDYRSIASNTELIQVDVHTLRFINGISPASSGSQRWRVFRLTMDFWFRLLISEQENFIVGYIPVGKAHADFNVFADRNYWRNIWESDPVRGFAVAFVDEENPPILSIERIGNVMHWKIEIGLACPP